MEEKINVHLHVGSYVASYLFLCVLCAHVSGIGILRAAPAEANVFIVLGRQQPARCTWGAGHRGRLRERGAWEQRREEEL